MMCGADLLGRAPNAPLYDPRISDGDSISGAQQFTCRVIEATDEGTLVLFAAGNCGGTCPDGGCGGDTGAGNGIWGADGHPGVMAVGAGNRLEQYVGHSSQGPASLDANKPNFCSITPFAGYFASDSGTSAATPIVAAVVALPKRAKRVVERRLERLGAAGSGWEPLGAAGSR